MIVFVNQAKKRAVERAIAGHPSVAKDCAEAVAVARAREADPKATDEQVLVEAYKMLGGVVRGEVKKEVKKVKEEVKEEKKEEKKEKKTKKK